MGHQGSAGIVTVMAKGLGVASLTERMPSTDANLFHTVGAAGSARRIVSVIHQSR